MRSSLPVVAATIFSALLSACGAATDSAQSGIPPEVAPLFRASSAIRGAAGGVPIMWGRDSFGVVSADKTRLAVDAFDTGDGTTVASKSFDDPVVGLEVGSTSDHIYAAVQTCPEPTRSNGDQHQLCESESTYVLVSFRPDASATSEAAVPFKASGDVSALYVTKRWIAARVGPRLHIFDRTAMRMDHSIDAPGVDPCLVGEYILARDPASVAAAPTTDVVDRNASGDLLVMRVGAAAEPTRVQLPATPSAMACGPAGAVVTSGTGLASEVAVVTVDKEIGARVVEHVSGSAVQATAVLNRKQVALVTTFIGGKPGALFVDPLQGVVHRVPAGASGMPRTDAGRDQALSASYFLDGTRLLAAVPTQGGWALGEVTQ